MESNISFKNKIAVTLLMLLPALKVLLQKALDDNYTPCAIVLHIFLGIILLSDFRKHMKRISFTDLVLIVFFFLSFVYSISINSHINFIFDEVIKDITNACLIGYIVTRFYDICEIGIDLIRKIAYIAFLLFVIIIVCYSDLYGTYSMTSAYIGLYVVGLLFIPYLYRPRWFDRFIILICIILLFFCGTRGPFLIAANLYLLFNIKKNYNLINIVLISITTISFLMLILFNFRMNDLESFNFSTRLMENITEGAFFSSSSRLYMYNAALSYCFEHPFWGCGIVGDRLVIAQLLNILPSHGTYPHNIFLELCMQYGLIGGLIIIISTTILSVKCYSRIKSNQLKKDTFLVLFAIGVIPLLISNSYLSWFPMYMFLGFIIKETNVVSFRY